MHLCSDDKNIDAVPEKKVQFWSHLTREPCSSHNVNNVWQTPSAFFCVLWSSGNPSNKVVVMEVASDGAF